MQVLRRYFLQIKETVGIDGLLVAILLALLCLRVWGFGPMHTDDAVWELMAHQPTVDPVQGWATSQGRIWALLIGRLMLHALFWQGTIYGEVLKLGSFAIFFVAFFTVVGAYWGRRTAGLAACLFLALFALRWEGSAFTTYPLLLWPSATCCAVSVLAGRRYFQHGGAFAFTAAALLLFAALFNNEGATVLFCALFLSGVLGNVGVSRFRELFSGRSRNLLYLGFLVPLIYAFASGTWVLTHPSKYDGHALAPFDLSNIIPTLLNFSLSGSVLYDMFIPYRVVYVDAMTETGSAIIYDFLSYQNQLVAHPVALLAGFLVAWATLATLRRPRPPSGSGWSAPFLILTGLAITFIAILPVAMTSKYQNWNLNFGINSYTLTIMAHFGVSLVLAGLLAPVIFRNIAGTIISLVLAAALGYFGAVGFRMNDAIAADMRPEAGRWRVLTLALMAIDATKQPPSVVFAPRFRSGTWFTVVPPNYWTDYVKAKFGRQIAIYTRPSEIANTNSDISMLDYIIMDDERRFAVTIAHAVGNAEQRRIDSISIMTERPDPSILANYVLSYRDSDGALVQKRLVDIPPISAPLDIRTLSNISARPDSVRLTKGSIMADSKKLEKMN